MATSEDFDFPALCSQAQNIDRGLAALCQKLFNSANLGTGPSIDSQLVDEVKREVSANEAMLNVMLNKLKSNISKLELRNAQRREFINHVANEISEIEEIGKEISFYIPDDARETSIEYLNISPTKSPSGLSCMGTPISIHNLSQD